MIICLGLAITTLVCAAFADSITVLASSRYPGVTQGQFLRYRIDVEFTSSNDTEFVSHVSEFPYHGFYNITVIQVSENFVTFHWIQYNVTSIFANSMSYFDIATGSGLEASIGIPFLVASNLAIGDSIYSSTIYEALRITESNKTDFLGLKLQTNHVHDTTNATNVSSQGFLFNQTILTAAYFDKPTGILLSFNEDVYWTRPYNADTLATLEQYQVSLISMSPIIPEFQSFLILPLFMIATLLAVKVYRREQ